MNRLWPCKTIHLPSFLSFCSSLSSSLLFSLRFHLHLILHFLSFRFRSSLPSSFWISFILHFLSFRVGSSFPSLFSSSFGLCFFFVLCCLFISIFISAFIFCQCVHRSVLSLQFHFHVCLYIYIYLILLLSPFYFSFSFSSALCVYGSANPLYIVAPSSIFMLVLDSACQVFFIVSFCDWPPLLRLMLLSLSRSCLVSVLLLVISCDLGVHVRQASMCCFYLASGSASCAGPSHINWFHRFFISYKLLSRISD